MSYTECKNGFIARGRELTSLFPIDRPWTVSDDIGNIKRGADYFIVTLPSTFQARRVDGTHKDMIWIIVFDFYVRFKTQKGAIARFEEARDLLIAHFHADPLLGRTPGVSDVLISASGEVSQDMPGTNPNFYIQTLNAAIAQRVRVATQIGA